MGKKINITLDEDASVAVQSFIDRINTSREAKGLQPATMRQLLGACILRCAAQDTVFLCGELLNNKANCDES